MHFSTGNPNAAQTANGEFVKEIREAVKSGKSDKDRDRRLLYKCGNENRRGATSRKIRLWRKMEQGFSKDKWCGVMCIHTNVLFSGYPQPIELQTSEIVSTTFNLTPLSGVIYFPFDPNSSVFYFIMRHGREPMEVTINPRSAKQFLFIRFSNKKWVTFNVFVEITLLKTEHHYAFNFIDYYVPHSLSASCHYTFWET